MIDYKKRSENYKKQIEKLKLSMQSFAKQLNDKTKESESLTLESQKILKAFKSVSIGISLPQIIQDYSDLHDLRNKQLENMPIQKAERNYLK